MFKRQVGFYGFFIILLITLITLPLVNVSYQLDQTFDFTNETQWEEDFPGNYGAFYENKGQLLNSDTILYSESTSRFVEFTKTSVTLWADETGSPITYVFHSANEITPKGLESISYSANFFLGSRGTFTNVKGYNIVIYENLWDDIDVIFRLAESGIKYEFRIHPGGDPQQILIDVEHCDSLNIEPNKMTLRCGQTEFIDEGILAYQSSSSIDVRFKEVGETRFGFSVGEYCSSELLVIDPLLYSTYVGGSAYEHIADLTIDNQGNAYVVGYTRSSNFPILNGNDSTLSGDRDAYIFKLDTSGNLVYSTFLGGSSSDEAYGVVVDSSGCAYVTGYSESSDFPTVNAYDSTLDGGSNCFIVKLNDVGNNLHISTYVNTTSTGKAITMDDMGNIYVLGGTRVFKMDSDLTEILYSFGISGSDYDSGEDLTVDSTGCAYVVGWTRSTDFPTFNAFDDTCNADDCFLFKINSTGTGLVFSTFIGGTGDEAGRNVRVDASGCIYITGQTASSNFPTLNPYFDSYNGSRDVFALKMNQTGNGLIYSTYIGGTNVDYAYGMDLDSHGCVYISVATRSSNFPVVNSYDSSWNGGTYDVVVLKLNQSGNDLLYSTFIGGSDFDHPWAMAVDDNGSAYVGIYTKSTNFPLVNAYDSSFNGDHDIAVCKLADLGDTDYDALSDYAELLLGTDRFDWDTDSDLMPDGWEVEYGLNATLNDAYADLDLDNLFNLDEYTNGTLPNNNDTDSDLMPDGWEVSFGLNPLEDDAQENPDGDAYNNLEEYLNGTNPIVADTPTTTTSTSTTSTSTSTSSTGGIQPTEDSSLVIIIAIVGVGIAAVVIVVLVMVKKKGIA